MKALGKETRCDYEDIKVYKTTDTDWLQGGTMNVTKGKVSILTQHQQVKIDKLGTWMAQQVQNEKRQCSS